MPTRNVRPFSHLRVHSAYSLGVGYSTPAAICRHAARAGFASVALTDIHGTFGFVEFHRAAMRCGIKPIYGVNLFVTGPTGSAGDGELAVVLIALDRRGLRAICDMTGRAASLRERGLPVPVSIFDGSTDGIVAVAGWWRDDDPGLLMHARATLGSMREIFGERMFVEARCGARGTVVSAFDGISHDLKIPRVLTQFVRYAAEPRGRAAAESEVPTGDRHTFGASCSAPGPENSMLDVSGVSHWFEAAPEAFSNAAVIAALVQPDLLAAMDGASATRASNDFWVEGGTAYDALRARVTTALKERVPDSRRDTYAARVESEMLDIARHNLARAFLDFAELTGALRDMRVALGPGTGMRLQSVCAWLLGITGFDPFVADPWFTPSLDEFARSLDLQAPLEAHGFISAALGRRFDAARIGYVPGLERITALRALRNAAASEPGGAPDGMDEVIAVAARHPGVTLRELIDENRDLSKRLRGSGVLRRVVARAARSEGLPWGFVRSRRTIAVSPAPLRDVLAMATRPDTGDRFVLATRDSFPSGGVVRIDISTLGALSALSTRKEAPSDEALSDAWPAEIVRMVRAGEVDGVYLLDTRGCRDALTGFAVRGFSDLVRFVALMRVRATEATFAQRIRAFGTQPGPYHDDMLVRPSCESYRTRGYLLFREQLRDVVCELTGGTREESARMLVRFSDREPAARSDLRATFMRACAEHRTRMDDASTWFVRLGRLVGRLPEYQSVVADAMIAARMIGYRYENRAGYYAALLRTSVPARRAELREAARREGLLLSPDLNVSGRDYRAENGRIRPPLWSIEGVRRETAEWIRRAARKKPFATWDDFHCLAGEKRIDYREVAALQRAGVLGAPPERSEQADTGNTDRRTGRVADSGRGDSIQLDLGFSPEPDEASSPGGNDGAERADPDARSIPARDHRPAHRVVSRVADFFPLPYAGLVELAGSIGDVQKLAGSSGQAVYFFVLSDDTAFVRVFAPGKTVVGSEPNLCPGAHVRVRGTVKKRFGKKVLHAREVIVTERDRDEKASPDAPAV